MTVPLERVDVLDAADPLAGVEVRALRRTPVRNERHPSCSHSDIGVDELFVGRLDNEPAAVPLLQLPLVRLDDVLPVLEVNIELARGYGMRGIA